MYYTKALKEVNKRNKKKTIIQMINYEHKRE